MNKKPITSTYKHLYIYIFIYLSAIIDIQDELDYWYIVKKHTNNREETKAAGKICSLLLPVSKQFKYFYIV